MTENNNNTIDFNSFSNEEQIAELFWKLPRAERRKLLKKSPTSNWTKFVYSSLFKNTEDGEQ